MRRKKIPVTLEERALAHVLNFKGSLKVTHDAMVTRLEEHQDIHRGIWRKSKHAYKGRSQRFLKEGVKGMDTLVANVTSVLLPGPIPVKFRGREPGDEEMAKRNEQLLAWQFDVTDLAKTVEEAVETNMWAGYCIMKVVYEKHARTVQGIGEVTETILDDDGNVVFSDDGSPSVKTRLDFVKRDIVDYAGPVASNVNPFNAWWDPRYKTFRRGPGVAEEYEASYQELLELEVQGIYKNVKALSDMGSDSPDTRLLETTDVPEPSNFDPYKKFKMTEFWGLFHLNGDDQEPEECVIVVANDQVVLRVERNPFWHGLRPYVLHRFSETGDGMGRGVCETIADDQYWLNDITNQRVDNVTLVLDRMWKYKRGSVLSHDLYSSPGHGIAWRDNPNEIEPILTPDVTASSYRETELCKQDIRETIGATNPVQGIPSTNKTATEISTLTTASNRRFLRLVKRYERGLLKPIAELFYMINQQTLNKSITFRLGIGDIITVDPEAVKGQYDVIPVGSTEMLSQTDAQAMIQFLQTLGVTGGIARWDIAGIEERIGLALGIRDISNLRLATPPAPAPEMGMGTAGPPTGVNA